jgi:hypothetical protein
MPELALGGLQRHFSNQMLLGTIDADALGEWMPPLHGRIAPKNAPFARTRGSLVI